MTVGGKLKEEMWITLGKEEESAGEIGSEIKMREIEVKGEKRDRERRKENEKKPEVYTYRYTWYSSGKLHGDSPFY